MHKQVCNIVSYTYSYTYIVHMSANHGKEKQRRIFNAKGPKYECRGHANKEAARGWAPYEYSLNAWQNDQTVAL